MSELPIHPEAEAPERPHAERSASQLKYLAICPGYRPERKKGEQHWVTQQGIRGHAAMEDADNDLQSDYEEKLVQLCKDYESTLPPAASELKELLVTTILDRFGYVDLLRFRVQPNSELNMHAADLVDYKFVRKAEVEDAEVNLQGKDYVIGVFDTFPQLGEVKAHFVMPRFGSVTTHTFFRSDLPRLRLEVMSILVQAKRTDRKRCAESLFKMDFDVCRYCGFKAKCPAMFKLAKQVAQAYVGHPIPEVPDNVHPSAARDPKTLGALKAIASVLEPWTESVNHHVTTTAIEEGIKPDGYEIDYQKGQRKITNPMALLSICPKYGVTIDDILSCSRVSIASLEDIVMANAPKKKKGFTKSAFLDELRDHDAIDRSEERPYLKKISPVNPTN